MNRIHQGHLNQNDTLLWKYDYPTKEKLGIVIKAKSYEIKRGNKNNVKTKEKSVKSYFGSLKILTVFYKICIMKYSNQFSQI